MNATRHLPILHTSLRVAIVTALILAPVIAMNTARACAACGDTLSNDWNTEGNTTRPGFTVDVSSTFINQNQQRYGSGGASPALINNQVAAGQEVEAYTKSEITTASLIYNDDTWGVSAQIPYLNRTHGTYGTTAPLGSSYSSSADSGIGDIKVVGRYNGFSENQVSGIVAGIKLPTGNTGANFNAGTAAGTPLDPTLQLGTGSTDVILGGYTSGTIESYGWFTQGTIQHAVVTQAALGNIYYRPGDAYSWNSGIGYAGYGAKISPMLQLNVISRQVDTLAAPANPVTGMLSTGGTLAYLSPGVLMRLGGGVSLYSFLQLPVYQNVIGLQLVPRYTFTMGVRQSFD